MKTINFNNESFIVYDDDGHIVPVNAKKLYAKHFV